MPRGDRTGPAGFGPLTGRAAGFCAGNVVPGYANPAPGRAFAGQGLGGRAGGRGQRNRYYATGMTGWQRAVSDFPPVYAPTPHYPTPAAFPARATPQQESEGLKNQIEFMEDSIKAARERIAELEEQEQ